ncbi:hypothetical protein F4859DRAFT_45893 [Xylaria cf. heliscus]|nr:hypothetical protein F4859DRAFT_45893 [Xylaria cf. heliscus]
MPSNRNRVTKRAATKRTRTTSSKTSQPNPSSSSSQPDADNNSPIYFWRPREPTTGYLSQWYATHPFRDRTTPSKIYATAEHYMMHHKALLFGDAEAAEAILAVPGTSAGKVKALGRAVRGFEQDTWERERARIVREGNWCKFSLPVLEEGDDGEKEEGQKGEQGELRTWPLGDAPDAPTVRARSFRDVLLATGDRELVEASPFDRIWGVGFAAKGAPGRRNKWGMNLLGKCLMDVREQFRKEAEAEAEVEDEVKAADETAKVENGEES